MDERRLFVLECQRGNRTMTDVCEDYGISRKTGYKWLHRFQKAGPEGLAERSRRPLECPHRTDPRAVEALLELRRRYPSWGPKKLLKLLRDRNDGLALPARSTACDILRKAGLVEAKPKRRRLAHPGRPRRLMGAPNDVWTIDFKGQFLTGDGIYCYPLTVADGYSRYLLGCRGLHSTKASGPFAVLDKLFRKYGIPLAILSDNGTPFAGRGLGRLSRLSVSWIRLGIAVALIQPGHPEQNGRHERMHRTLKRETALPPASCLTSQQRRFQDFLRVFNHIRPHEALELETPASCYVPSSRRMPSCLAEPEYPGHWEVRRVRTTGGIKWKGQEPFLSSALSGQRVGLEEVDDGIWKLYFHHQLLATVDVRTMRFEDVNPPPIKRRRLN